MNEKHHEVSVWLDKLYGGENVPQYEINERTIDILHSLMTANHKQDERASRVTDDMLMKADEYSAEADRIGHILNTLGVGPTSLSQAGASSLRSLSQVALLLEVKDTTDSSLLLSLSDLTRENLKLKESRKLEKKLSAKLFTKTKQALQKASTLQKALENLEEQAKQQGPDLAQKAKQASFLQSKACEYKAQMADLQHELTSQGVEPSIYHSSLTQKEEELKQLKEKFNPLKAKLDSYHKLPPDVSLSRVKVEEAKRELARLEEELSRSINLMHM